MRHSTPSRRLLFRGWLDKMKAARHSCIAASQKDLLVRIGIPFHLVDVGVWATLLVIASGCDITGEYERRFTETLQQSGQRAVFDLHLYAAETDVTDGSNQPVGVKLRIPKIFDGESKSLPNTDPRAQPPFLMIPGLGYALERALDDDAKKLAPAYIYFAAVPKADQKPDQVQAPITAAMAAAFPGAAWADVQVTTPQGTTNSVKVIRGDGPQDFDSTASNGAIEKLDGRFALYFIEGPNHYAFIGFRAPKAQSDRFQLETAIQAAIGTVTTASSGAAPAGGAAPAATAPAGASPMPPPAGS